MKIILSDKTELNPIIVTGGTRYVQGDHRDTLSFVFPADAGMEALDAVFTSSACESIIIFGDDESEAIHTGYTIRAELSKRIVEVTPATDETEAVFEDRITVAMSQRTYAENQIAQNAAALNALLTGEV